jgi:hypothetical protein
LRRFLLFTDGWKRLGGDGVSGTTSPVERTPSVSQPLGPACS